MFATALEGRTLGRYVIEREIGRGATSVVYQAEDLQSRRAVALKIACPPSSCDSPPIDLVREGVWLTYCRAPHVVQVFEVTRDAGAEFIAMELMASTLEMRTADGPVSSEELVGIGTGILLGLDAAHREGICHGDIKPANVGISLRGTVKLLDFGVARPLPGSPLDLLSPAAGGAIIGTVPYMAPEQVRGREPDERTDIYAVAAVLFELATGRPPFCEQALTALLDAVLHAEPPRASSLNPLIEPDIDKLLMTALAKAPSARFNSAQEMLNALLDIDAAQSRRTAIEPGATDGVHYICGAL
jgi:serine/threonine protein kinase